MCGEHLLKRVELFEHMGNHQLKLNCSKRLVFDCTMRLNSTYLMKVALIYKDVFTRLKHRDNQYKQALAY